MKLLMAIEKRTRYLDRAFPKSQITPRGALMPVVLPSEPWAERYQGIKTLPESLLPQIEKVYGAEAKRRNESPIVTMMRHAANAGSCDSDQKVDEQAHRASSELLYSLVLTLPDSGRAEVENFIIEQSEGVKDDQTSHDD